MNIVRKCAFVNLYTVLYHYQIEYYIFYLNYIHLKTNQIWNCIFQINQTDIALYLPLPLSFSAINISQYWWNCWKWFLFYSHRLEYFQRIDFRTLLPQNWAPDYQSKEWESVLKWTFPDLCNLECSFNVEVFYMWNTNIISCC